LLLHCAFSQLILPEGFKLPSAIQNLQSIKIVSPKSTVLAESNMKAEATSIKGEQHGTAAGVKMEPVVLKGMITIANPLELRGQLLAAEGTCDVTFSTKQETVDREALKAELEEMKKTIKYFITENTRLQAKIESTSPATNQGNSFVGANGTPSPYATNAQGQRIPEPKIQQGQSVGLCLDFLSGLCQRGASCRYTHTDHELATQPGERTRYVRLANLCNNRQSKKTGRDFYKSVESAVAALVNALIQDQYNGGVVSGPFTIGGNIVIEFCSTEAANIVSKQLLTLWSFNVYSQTSRIYLSPRALARPSYMNLLPSRMKHTARSRRHHHDWHPCLPKSAFYFIFCGGDWCGWLCFHSF
jgi:hypothetical protein